MPILRFISGCFPIAASTNWRGDVKPLHVLLAMVFVTLLPACAHHTQPPIDTSASLRAMTFNIRLDTASDGPNAWSERQDMVAALIRHESPDLLGLQEVLLGQKHALEAALLEYGAVGVARDDGKDRGEFSPLFYRTERFILLDSGTFWLSPTPNIPSKGWDAALPRIVTWAVLHDRKTNSQIRVLNTHFDHVGSEAKAMSASMIVDWLDTGIETNIPTIVMGDFNSPPGSEPYRRLAASPDLRDSRTASQTPPYGPAGTFTGFDITRDASQPIDHIFVTRDFLVESHAIITQHWGGRLPSDHYPVLAVLRSKER